MTFTWSYDYDKTFVTLPCEYKALCMVTVLRFDCNVTFCKHILIISVIFNDFMKYPCCPNVTQCVHSHYLTSDVRVSSLFQEQLGHISTTFVGCPHESCPSSLSRKYTDNNA